MTTKHASRWRSLLAVAAVAALVAGMPPDASAKKKPPKNVLTATINGKSIKFRRYVSIQAGGTTVALSVIGQTRPHGILRTLGVGCADFPPATVPGSVQLLHLQLLGNEARTASDHQGVGASARPPVAWTFPRTMGAWSVAPFPRC